ncbi:MAG: chemotaxis protein CheW [Gammaproteobacteria bacterium]|nr:chemotaxis protein CheW [Gammaproteobacteria bacterium]
MSQNQAVRCMLLPLSGINLVVPNSAVSEVIGFTEPRKFEDAPEWFLGAVLWRGVYVPVVSVEQMCGIDTVHIGPRSRISIIYNPEKDEELPYIGLHIQDIPRAYLAEGSKMESGSDDGLSQYLLSRVDDDQASRVIPNLDAIAVELKSQLSQEKLDKLSH